MIFEKTKIINQPKLGGGFKYFLCSPRNLGKIDIHQLEKGLESHSIN